MRIRWVGLIATPVVYQIGTTVWPWLWPDRYDCSVRAKLRQCA